MCVCVCECVCVCTCMCLFSSFPLNNDFKSESFFKIKNQKQLFIFYIYLTPFIFNIFAWCDPIPVFFVQLMVKTLSLVPCANV